MYEGMGFNCLEIVCEADLSHTSNCIFHCISTGPVDETQNGLPDILCVLQVQAPYCAPCLRLTSCS